MFIIWNLCGLRSSNVFAATYITIQEASLKNQIIYSVELCRFVHTYKTLVCCDNLTMSYNSLNSLPPPPQLFIKFRGGNKKIVPYDELFNDWWAYDNRVQLIHGKEMEIVSRPKCHVPSRYTDDLRLIKSYWQFSKLFI